MDGQQFDALTRAAAAVPSRRAVIGAAFGGLAAAVLGDRAEAAVKRGLGEICRKNGDCASGVCGPSDRTGRQYCSCSDPSQCPQPKDACHVATCAGGACGVAVNVGATCDDKNVCTTGDTCQADGSCGGGTPTGTPGGTPTVTLDFSPSGDPRFCVINIHLRAFDPINPYTIHLLYSFANGGSGQLDSFQVTTDACGNADFTPYSFCNQACNTGMSLQVTVDSVSSASEFFVCPG